jgi:hypothetical protein
MGRLTLYSCRFIPGDVSGFQTIYCGEKTHKGPYCEEHYKICYTSAPPVNPRVKE